jgi:transaldolase/glucose-6-phosphate isomerase
MTKIHGLAEIGQAIWVDFIRRGFITTGQLQALVDQGVQGVTSNPSIFEKAIAGSTDYDGALEDLVAAGLSVDQIYEALAIDDIRSAADVLRPTYDTTGGADGYVSLEVSPHLAHDTASTVAEARRLFGIIARPNVMIKVPATPAGVPAITSLIGEGINVNVTLIFSLEQYEAIARAYIAGLEQLAAAGGNVGHVGSVASFFVSRIDTAVDRALDGIGATDLQGKIAIASARVAYARFHELFRGQPWERLAALGARPQRPLWASTSTKNPDYPDTMYVDHLIGPQTVNTVPPDTLAAFLEHGQVALTLEQGLVKARQQLASLADLGIDLRAITQKLQDDGVEAFARSFDALLQAIADKRAQFLASKQSRLASLGSYQHAVDLALEEMARERVVARIWEHDHAVWKPEPAEITNRLGWLHIAPTMEGQVSRMQALAETLRKEGYRDVLLLGMGGSSLAPEVLANIFGGQSPDGLKLAVLDSTDPGAVLAHAERLDPARTLFIVATKSGGTVETLSFFRYFYNWTAEALGADRAGAHFVGITDPGSKLEELGKKFSFREVFLNDPNIGGRYSALSYFGLVPAALVGVDLEKLLERALIAARSCGPSHHATGGDNDGAWLGAILGELAKRGRDKLTLVVSPALANLGDWMEQLVAESTGKEGQGILPVVGEPLAAPAVYGEDRLFVYLRLQGVDGGSETYDLGMQALEEAGHPVVRLPLQDLYDLGQQFFLWEFATAVAGHCLGINPFNQPNVEAAKALARKAVATYAQEGTLPADEPAPLEPAALAAFLSSAQAGDYVALQAYLQPTAKVDAALLALRARIRDRLKLATTLGYGPRFLHSTGQLHKGDRGNGLFIQFTADSPRDLPIPDAAGSAEASMSFGVLELAQALGDKQALQEAGRRVIRFHLGKADPAPEIQRLAEALA